MASPRADDSPSNQGGFKTWWSSLGTRAMSPQRTEFPSNFPLPGTIFGQPLHYVLKCSSVPIRLADVNGEPYIWGYIPAIVAKTGLHLKQHGLNVEGVFRVGGSEKRVRELQDIFDTAPNVRICFCAHIQYGKVIDWSPFTIHDVAGLLRRYLNQMPEPIIPKNMSRKFCRVMTKRDLEQGSKIEQYRRLITSIPQANQYLLLYILDLLAVVETNSHTNKMTAQNLAIVFQPSILSHPHLDSKDEHLAAVEVIEFLIEHQDHFVLALSKPPPKDVPPEELTSQIPAEIEDYVIIPSDSDEEVSEYQVHIGGGSLLAKSQTSTHPRFGKLDWKKRLERMPTTPTDEEPKHLNLNVANSTSPHRSGLSSPLFPPSFFRRRSISQTDGGSEDHRMPAATELSKTHEQRSFKPSHRPSIRVSPPSSSVKPERSISSNGVDSIDQKYPYTSLHSPVRSDECLVTRPSSDHNESPLSTHPSRHSVSRPPFRKSHSARHSSRLTSPPSPEVTYAPGLPMPALPLEKIHSSPTPGSTFSSDQLSTSSYVNVMDALGPVKSSSEREGQNITPSYLSAVSGSHESHTQTSLGSSAQTSSLPTTGAAVESTTSQATVDPLEPSSNNSIPGTIHDDIDLKFAKVVLTLSAPKSLP